MDANAFRYLLRYHFWWSRFLFSEYLPQVAAADLVAPLGYSKGSIRDQMVHLVEVDEAWFGDLLGEGPGAHWDETDGGPTLDAILARRDAIEAKATAYLAGVTDEALASRPYTEGEDKDLHLWQILLHVVNHGTDHRAQVLRQLNDLGIATTSQDLVFFAYEVPFAGA